MFELKTDGIARRDQNELASPLQSGPILQSYPRGRHPFAQLDPILVAYSESSFRIPSDLLDLKLKVRIVGKARE